MTETRYTVSLFVVRSVIPRVSTGLTSIATFHSSPRVGAFPTASPRCKVKAQKDAVYVPEGAHLHLNFAPYVFLSQAILRRVASLLVRLAGIEPATCGFEVRIFL